MNYVDPAQLGDWCSNTNTRVLASAIPTDPVIAAHLAGASGEFESAVIRGGRYQPSDFANLTGNDLQYVVRLVCHLAKYTLWARKTRKGSDAEVPAGCQEAKDTLEALGRGERVFAFLETVVDSAGGEVAEFTGLPLPETPRPPPSAAATPYFGQRLTPFPR
jgi:hypothetical protein